jgi:glycerate kinase
MRGLGAGIAAGSAALMDLAGLPEAIAAADLVITGEGRYDAQSGQGKVVGGVLGVAAANGVDSIVICGCSDLPPDPTVIELAELAGSPEESLRDPRRWLQEAGARAARSVDGALQ